MCRIALMLAVLMVSLVTPVPQGDGKKEKEKQDFYPLRVGTRWELDSQDGIGPSQTVVYEVKRIEIINGLSLARIETHGIDGIVAHTFHVSASDREICSHTTDGVEIVPAWCFFKYPVKEGQTWVTSDGLGEHKCQVGKWEEVEVPAGKFKAISVRLEAPGHVQTYWFVNNVGIIKREVDLGGQKVTMKLRKFEKGK